MRKTLLYAVPVTFILVSLTLMISGGWLKEPMGDQDELLKSVQNIEQHVKRNEWQEAKREHTYTKKAWTIVSKRIQYSVGKESLSEVSQILSRMEGAIEANDANVTLVEAYSFYELWENLG
ncbi:DUF4363 family protein [Halalkalibacter alkaliphilus]|uniref:DUF4363 family protein n=1 Tax=Halalkalibacter alkaliphilus TaxID=2917993 RepID=A0A9X2CU59_9BACI|nr:DUF4363 family protein [Halalkalibacter alkaliphilus]MCL7748380.1 DUF4363 family protein [Halalkalibacter alkaliphilus]